MTSCASASLSSSGGSGWYSRTHRSAASSRARARASSVLAWLLRCSRLGSPGSCGMGLLSSRLASADQAVRVDRNGMRGALGWAWPFPRTGGAPNAPDESVLDSPAGGDCTMERMTALLSIGEIASRTGLPVRTIRFYSDSGVVPPAHRSEAGYRLYGPDALARLGLVRTLRDLGLDLATIRRVLEREGSLTDVAAAHAAALGAQIRVLRVQKAVLQAVARRGSDSKEMQQMHRLAQLSDDERKRIVAGFLDHVFDGLDIDPGFEARLRAAAPELPDDPTPEQVDAWIELAELVQDPGFRDSIRRMSEQQSASRQAG